jgi:hypothetical protein
MDVVASLSDMIASNQSLTSLNLSDNRQLLDTADAASLFRDGLLSNTGKLRDLNLASTGLTHEAMDMLAVGCLSTLRTLSLRRAHVSRRALLLLLDSSMQLQVLNLSQCGMDHMCAQVLSLVLAAEPTSSCTLLDLNVSGDRMGAVGMEALCLALESNVSLKTLVLSSSLEGDFWGLHEIETLAASLPRIKHLERLHLTCRMADKTMPRFLLDGLKKNTSLNNLELDHDFGTGPWDHEISFYMLRNKYIPLLNAAEHGVAISVWPRIIVTLQEFPSQPALSLIHHVLQVMQWGERANGSVTPLETPYRTDQTT